MWDLLEVSIPAVVLLPLVAVGAVLWMCFQQNARSSDVRRAEFQRLQRLAMEEHERAERELEREYMRHKQGADPHGLAEPHQSHQPHQLHQSHQSHQSHRGGVDLHGGDIRRRGGPPGNGYGNMDIGLGEWRDPEIDARRAQQAEEEDQRRKQAEAAVQRRKQADAEEFRRKQEEMADRKRRENLEDEMRRRQAEEQDWQRRRADLEAQAKRDAEEERRRQAAEQEERQRRWKQEEALRQESAHTSPRNVHPMSSLNCVVCHRPTRVKRRCSRCKSMNYCSRECQVQHWSDGHKSECRPHDPTASPRGSIDGDARNYSDFSPRS